MRPQAVLGLALIMLAASGASARPAKKKAQWPVRNPLIRSKRFTPTVKARILSAPYGPRLKWGVNRYDHHEGWDFFAFYDPSFPSGHHPAHAALPGLVHKIIRPPNPERVETGNKVILRHGISWAKFGAPKAWGEIYTAYLHLSSIDVTLGQKLKAGEILGAAGATGYTKTVHLHFNCYRRGPKGLINVNPARLFAKRDWVTPLSKRSAKVFWLSRKGDQLSFRILIPFNCLSFDGFTLEVDGDRSRSVSFEWVSAMLRDRRDTGDRGLFPKLRLYPLKFNGGEATARLNKPGRIPAAWPANRYPVPGDTGVSLGWDVVAEVPAAASSITLTLRGVNGEKIKLKGPKR